MKRRDFIKATGVGVAGGNNCRAGDRAIVAGNQMAHDLQLAEIP